MKLSIWTHWEGRSWSGEIPDVPGITDPAALLEHVFRYFNRVDPADESRLEGVGYRLPSLSVGDVVTLDGSRWQCAVLGWEQLAADAEPLTPDALRGLPIATRRDGPRARIVSSREIAENGGRLDASYYIDNEIGREL